MPDFGAPVADKINIDPNQGIKTLSQILDVRQKQQALQGQAAQVQQEQQSARQRQAIAGIDWGKYADDSGVVSTDKMLGDKDLQQRAGDQFQKILELGANVRGKQLENVTTLAGLDKEMRSQLASVGGALIDDPDVKADNAAGRAKVDGAFARFVKDGGPQAQKVVDIYGDLTKAAPKGQLQLGLMHMQQQGQSADAQANLRQKRLVDTGAKLTETNPYAASGDLPKTVSPGNSTFSDQAGNVWSFNPQDPTKATLVGHGGKSGQGAAPSNAPSSVPNAPPVMSVGGQANANSSAVDDEGLYKQVKGAADKAPITKDIISNIQTLADQTTTGKYSKQIADAEAAISQRIPGFKGAGDAATKRQLLGKYIQQLLLQTEQANGASTDAAQAHVAAAIPDAEHMTPDAIKEASRLILAQTHIGQARGAVAEKYKSEHGGSTQGLQAVDSAFMQHVDPRAFEFIGLSGDERRAFLKKNFGSNPQGQKAFADQLAMIDHMGGFVPWKGAPPQTGGASGKF